jgi:hypothetical protein
MAWRRGFCTEGIRAHAQDEGGGGAGFPLMDLVRASLHVLSARAGVFRLFLTYVFRGERRGDWVPRHWVIGHWLEGSQALVYSNPRVLEGCLVGDSQRV